MDEARKKGRASSAEAQDVHRESQQQKHGVARPQAEGQLLSSYQACDGDGWDRQSDRRTGRPERDIQAALQFVVERSAERSHRFRHQHKRCNERTDDCVSLPRSKRLKRILDPGGYSFSQKNDARQANEQEQDIAVDAAFGGNMLPFHRLDEFLDEILPAQPHLGVDETAIKQDGKDAYKSQLHRREDSVPGRQGVVRQDKGENGKRRQQSEISVGALALQLLMVMAQTAEGKAKPDNAAADDHNGGEHRFPRQRRVVFPMEHHGNDDRDFDDRDGKGENKRAVGFADAMRNRLGVMERREDRRKHQRYRQDAQHDADGDIRVFGRKDA
jgi:hypothetical protein